MIGTNISHFFFQCFNNFNVIVIGYALANAFLPIHNLQIFSFPNTNKKKIFLKAQQTEAEQTQATKQDKNDDDEENAQWNDERRKKGGWKLS